MTVDTMPHVPGLRSPYVKVGRLVYFGRMLDKIRLQAEGRLPAEYAANFGEVKSGVFDARCCRFLGVSHADLAARVAEGGNDEALLAWAEERGTPRNDEACEIWNAFMTKRGWRDEAAGLVAQRVAESGFEGLPIATMFDYIDFDEGRDPTDFR